MTLSDKQTTEFSISDHHQTKYEQSLENVKYKLLQCLVCFKIIFLTIIITETVLFNIKKKFLEPHVTQFI